MRYRASFIIFFFLTLSLRSLQVQAADSGPEPGKLAPPIELADLTGKNVSLSQFKGHIVLLNFWSTLCAPCTAEMPSLNRLYLALKDQGLQVVAVAIDASDAPVRDFASAKHLAFPVLVDKEKEFFFDEYAGPSLPASYLIDRSGVIVENFTGPREWDSRDMKSRVRKLLEKR